MSTQQIIENRAFAAEVKSKLHEIAYILEHNETRFHGQGIGFGTMGLIIFWTYYYQYFEDEKILKKISLLLGKHYNVLKSQAFVSDLIYFRTATDQLSQREKELCECGWGYELLASQEIIEPEHTRKVLETTNIRLYRKMIDIIMNPLWAHLSDALMIGYSCTAKQERIPKEFLRRFVSELHNQVNQPCFDERSRTIEPHDLLGILMLLSKIEQQHTNILWIPECRDKIYTTWIKSDISLFDRSDHHIQERDLWLLYAMMQDVRHQSQAIEILKHAEHSINAFIKSVALGAGMERGLVCFGHMFNKLYRQTQNPFFETISALCYQRFLRMTTTMESGKWSTFSQGMFHVNFGIKNGLAGIGLALLAYVSNANPQWDEYFYF